MKRLNFWLAALLLGLHAGPSPAAGGSDPACDWSNLAAFRSANAALGPPAAMEHRVVFMGDSITAHWNAAAPGFFGNPAYVNRGVSGQGTGQMLLRFRADVIELRPSVVVILGGTNDIAADTEATAIGVIEGNIASMAELARAHGIGVVLASVLPASGYWWSPRVEPAAKIVALNGWIREFARRNGFAYVDYYTPMADNRGGLRRAYSDDGVHPNAAGYGIMGPLAEQAIAAALSHP